MDNRRQFLKKSGFLVMGVAISSAEPVLAKKSPEKWTMIIDLNRCTGCQSCVIACKNQSKTTAGEFNTKVLSIETGSYPAARIVYTPIQCNHCDDPPCVKACSVGATFKLTNGIVVTDWDRCQSKGTCVIACPYGARHLSPQYNNKVDKCDFCLDRLEKGLQPACVESCPSKARVFGDLHNPQGEFADYVKKAKLIVRKPESKTGPQIHYVPSFHAQEAVI